MKERLEKLLENSYAPYSKMHFACMVETENGNFYEGVNIENASFGATICAERVAYSKAISEGEKDFVAICITCSSKENFAYPCGVCRQFMSEFSINTKVIVAKSLKKFEIYNLNELLPHNFNSDSL